MTNKSFVLDTNVLLHDPEAVLKFSNNNVIVSVNVLEELGNLKKYRDELGKNARRALRLLDSLQEIGSGDLHKGVELENGPKVRIQLDPKSNQDPQDFLTIHRGYQPNRIIFAAYYLMQKGEKVVFVSKDFTSRVKAKAMGIEVQDYENLKASFDGVCRRIRRVEVDKKNIDLLYRDGFTSIDFKENHFLPNEYCCMLSPEGSRVLAKYRQENKDLVQLLPVSRPIWGVQALNEEQQCALDLLLRDDIKLVVLVGQAGTGKTLLAVACGLQKVFDEDVYSRLLISRPIMPLGKDIGYLPGSKDEKLESWMQPIYDNLEFLCDSFGGEPNETLRWVIDSKKIEMEAVTYIRGRTLQKSYVIIDEAQNLTGHEIKTIISRAGKNTKIILTGDPTQIDNPYLDQDSNGITLTIAKFREHKIFGHIFLETTERSELAALAADLM